MEKKRSTSKVKRLINDYVIITVGSIIFALGIVMFTAPNNIAPGGASGIGTMINYLFKIPIGVTVIIINIPLFIVSFKKFGKIFLAKSLYATMLTAVLIDTFPYILEKHYIYSPLLAAIFGGVCVGIGVGIVFLRGGTTGGADILAKLLKQKHPHLSMGTLVFMLDAVVVLSTLFVYRSIEVLLYSVVLFFVTSRAVDAIIFGAAKSKMLLIITTRPKEISERIIKEVEHGVTLLPAFGGYTNEGKTIILSVVRPNEVTEITAIVKELDRNAFTIITDSNEVLGFGFSK